MQIWLARHGTGTIENDQCLGLTDDGKAEMERMAAFLRHQRIATPLAIITAPVRRNLESAGIVAAAIDGPVATLHLRQLANEDPSIAAMSLYQAIGQLDRGLEFTPGDPSPVPTVLVIGNKRNNLLEIVGMAIDPAGTLGSLCDDPRAFRGYSVEQLEDLIESGEAERYLSPGRKLEAFGKARLVGFSFPRSSWCEAMQPGRGRQIFARSFAARPEKIFLDNPFQPK